MKKRHSDPVRTGLNAPYYKSSVLRPQIYINNF
jgi:hypothetical protein